MRLGLLSVSAGQEGCGGRRGQVAGGRRASSVPVASAGVPPDVPEATGARCTADQSELTWSRQRANLGDPVSLNRPRHPKKDLEAVCQTAEAAGWQIMRGTGYFKAYCPCGLHKRTLHLSPSDPNYARNVAHWFRRQPCWPKESI